MAMGKQSLQDFLGDWRICPLHTFRHGFQRTWIVRSAQEPIEKLIPHDFGLAVINESVQRKSAAATERFQPPRTKADFPPLSNRFIQGPSHAPKSWVGVVVGDSSSAISSPTERVNHVGVVGAAAASRVPQPAAAATVVAAPASQVLAQPVSVQVPGQSVANSDLANLMAAAIEAALRPLREKLDATITPMQRTLESLQAEFISIREEKDDHMQTTSISASALEQEAKRLRTGSAA